MSEKSNSESQKDKLSSVSQKSIKSNRSSKSKNTKIDIDSEDISISQLELMANKRKLNKKSLEMTIKHTESLSNDKKESSKMSLSVIEPKKESKKQHKKEKLSTATLSSSANSHDHRKEKAKLVTKENRIDSVRIEKSEFLYKFNKLNANGKFSSLKLDMNNSLDEIKNEFERIKNEMQTERSVSFLKRMLLLGVQGAEMLNTRFDPMGVDLDGWSESMGYSLENQEYDEVLAELYEKYKGKGQMSPEMKMLFMIISSATMFTITKKITKMESSNPFKNFINSFVGGNQAPVQMNQQNYQEYQGHTHDQSQGGYQTEISSDDGQPSKLKDPNGNSNDIDLNNILKRMNERKQEKEKQLQKQLETVSSDDLFKSIPLNKSKKGRGRPRKPNPSLKGL